ncbi:hypothetical protein JHD49_09610 [Sulfurimonas sp. SAG-AH-194-C21]|nr:hypothetical protein [Sulfurimonas sp. SAG-AH-194-C21]MDF1884196.1 hypothetical protein [Sulfurimonas sp. SAG-AH-194-C21]
MMDSILDFIFHNSYHGFLLNLYILIPFGEVGIYIFTSDERFQEKYFKIK